MDKRWWIVIVLVVVLAIIGIGIFFALNGGNADLFGSGSSGGPTAQEIGNQIAVDNYITGQMVNSGGSVNG